MNELRLKPIKCVCKQNAYPTIYGAPNSYCLPSHGAQFRLPSEPLKRTQAAEVTPRCRRRYSARAKVHQNGRRHAPIAVEQARGVSRRYLFPPLRNP